MALKHNKPNPALLAELDEVARHAAAFRQVVRIANALPDAFPIEEIQRITVTLEELPAGTAEGCRVPLDYGRLRLAEIGQQQIKIEGDRDAAIEEAPPALARGMAIDQALGKLLSAITYAQAEYARQAGEGIEEEEPAPRVRPEAAIAHEIGVLASASESVEGEFEALGVKIDEIMVPGSERADQLRRQGRDAEGHVRLAGNELQQDEPRPSRLERITVVLNRLPDLIEATGQALKVGIDIAEPFADQWFNQIPTDIFKMVVKHLRNFASNLEEAGRRLNERHSPASSVPLATQGKKLRAALEREQLSLVYQPQVDLKSGRLVGVETLVRWHDPELGLISPDQFIPLAEETGLIYDMGLWVLRSACRQHKRWQEAGLTELRLAVNMSSPQLQQDGIEKDLARVFETTDMDLNCLELEMPESIFLLLSNDTEDILHRLHNMGITLAMDDFGTGYSSLSLLRRYPIERIKIDRSFINGITTNESDSSVVRAVIQLAHNGLNIGVIAEGVETEAQLNLLREYGCDEAQGYALSRPIPGDQVLDLAATGGRAIDLNVFKDVSSGSA